MFNSQKGFGSSLVIFLLLMAGIGVGVYLSGQRTKIASEAAVSANINPVFSGLAGYWKHDEGTGTTTKDSVGQSNGTFIGSPNWETGKIGKALYFNGSNEAITINNNPSINLTQNFSIAAWIRAGSISGRRAILAKVTDTNFKQFSLGTEDSKLHFMMEDNNREFNLYSPSNTIKKGTWQHVAVTVDPSFLATLYVNGKQVGSGTIPVDRRGVASTQALSFGRWSGSYNSNYFNGRIDEAGLWNRSLSVLEVSQLYNSGNGLPFILPSPSPTTPPILNVGKWDELLNWPLVVVHMALLQTGEVLMWDGQEVPTTPARLWNPVTQQFTSVPMTYSAIYCAGMAQLPDGRMIVVGGHTTPGTQDGIKNISFFDPVSKAWSPGPDMAYPRWYPNVTVLGNNKVFLSTGIITGSTFADTPEIFDVGSKTVTTLPDASTSFSHTYYSDSYLLPNGTVAYLSPGTGGIRIFDPATNSFVKTLPNSPVIRGTAVMYEPGKILLSGGGNWGGSSSSNNYAATIDLNQASPVWTTVSSMNVGRYKHHLVLLPDGRVLAVGGTSIVNNGGQSGPKSAEVWNPKTNIWTLLPEMTDPRYYHSTALLLPDGRVLAAGGGRRGSAVNYQTAQIYNPDYLFIGTRPTISGTSQAGMNYNSDLTVSTPNAGSISRVTLVRPGSVTHAVDMDTRFVELSFTKNADSVIVKGPANSNIAPGGYYMMFIINSEGVPSVAKMIKIS